MPANNSIINHQHFPSPLPIQFCCVHTWRIVCAQKIKKKMMTSQLLFICHQSASLLSTVDGRDG